MLFAGLEYIHYLTATNRQLSIYLEDHVGEVRHANYSTFFISNSSTNYVLTVRFSILINMNR